MLEMKTSISQLSGSMGRLCSGMDHHKDRLSGLEDKGKESVCSVKDNNFFKHVSGTWKILRCYENTDSRKCGHRKWGRIKNMEKIFNTIIEEISPDLEK